MCLLSDLCPLHEKLAREQGRMNPSEGRSRTRRWVDVLSLSPRLNSSEIFHWFRKLCLPKSPSPQVDEADARCDTRPSSFIDYLVTPAPIRAVTPCAVFWPRPSRDQTGSQAQAPNHTFHVPSKLETQDRSYCMGCGVNVDPILTLGEQTADKTMETIQLKPFQDSLADITHMPPEILGYIFQLAIELKVPGDGDIRFAVAQQSSYSFLLVCRRWYAVARLTPDLWNCWGNNLGDWRRRYLCHENSPVDLVLDGTQDQTGPFGEALEEALKSRAARGLIHRVHLRDLDTNLSTSILSSLTPEDDSIRHCNIQSIVLPEMDISNFFARHHFPKLRDLYLARFPDLNRLMSHTGAIVNLTLENPFYPPFTPTASDILSLLASNPNLQTIDLTCVVIEDDLGSGHRPQVPLPHLRRFAVIMPPRPALALRQRLNFPDKVGVLSLGFFPCALEEGRQVLGSYIRDYLQGQRGWESDLRIFVKVTDRSFSLKVVGKKLKPHDRHLPLQGFSMWLPGCTWEEKERLSIDIVTLLPSECITHLSANLSVEVVEKFLVALPKVESLHLHNAMISDSFLLLDQDAPNARMKPLLSLRQLSLEYEIEVDNDWDLLVRYLTRQTSGDQRIFLKVSGKGVRICSEVRGRIEELTERFIYIPDSTDACPLDCARYYL